jgi:hypothetical protein
MKPLKEKELYKVTFYHKNKITHQSISICDTQMTDNGFLMDDIIVLVSEDGIPEEMGWFLVTTHSNMEVEHIKDSEKYQEQYPEYFI